MTSSRCRYSCPPYVIVARRPRMDFSMRRPAAIAMRSVTRGVQFFSGRRSSMSWVSGVPVWHGKEVYGRELFYHPNTDCPASLGLCADQMHVCTCVRLGLRFARRPSFKIKSRCLTTSLRLISSLQVPMQVCIRLIVFV